MKTKGLLVNTRKTEVKIDCFKTDIIEQKCKCIYKKGVGNSCILSTSCHKWVDRQCNGCLGKFM